MTMYLLNGGEQVSLPARPIVVRLQASGVLGEHRLVAAVPYGEPVAVRRPGMLLLPRIDQPTTVRLFPALGSELFPPQTQLNVLVGPDGLDPDADHVSLSVDVSGLPLRELVTLEPSGATVTVTALGRRVDPRLSPDAEAARDVARELLGVPFVAADAAVDVRVGIDISPSMRPYADDGSLAALLEVFAGLASVIDPNAELEAVLCGRTIIGLPPEPLDRFAAAAVAEVGRQPLVTGLRTSGLPGASPGVVSYLISDAVPPDLDRRHDDPPHVVVLGDPAFAQAGTLAEVPASTVVPVAVGSVSVAAGSGGPEPGTALRWERHQLRAIVGSLLVSYQQQVAG